MNIDHFVENHYISASVTDMLTIIEQDERFNLPIISIPLMLHELRADNSILYLEPYLTEHNYPGISILITFKTNRDLERCKEKILEPNYVKTKITLNVE